MFRFDLDSYVFQRRSYIPFYLELNKPSYRLLLLSYLFIKINFYQINKVILNDSSLSSIGCLLKEITNNHKNNYF